MYFEPTRKLSPHAQSRTRHITLVARRSTNPIAAVWPGRAVVASARDRLFTGGPGVAERCHGGEFLGDRSNVSPFAGKVVGDRAAQRRIGDEVCGMGCDREVAAGELMLALCAGLDACELARDRELDRLIVA